MDPQREILDQLALEQFFEIVQGRFYTSQQDTWDSTETMQQNFGVSLRESN